MMEDKIAGIILVGGWAIVGLVNLLSTKEISKTSYLCIWVVAMGGLVYRFLL